MPADGASWQRLPVELSSRDRGQLPLMAAVSVDREYSDIGKTRGRRLVAIEHNLVTIRGKCGCGIDELIVRQAPKPVTLQREHVDLAVTHEHNLLATW